MKEKIYEWEEFRSMLEYLDFEYNDIMDFEEYYQNMNKPNFNLEQFIKFINFERCKE